MGRTKALLEIADTSFIGHILQNIDSAGIKDVYVVLGREEKKIRSSVSFNKQVIIIINPDPDQGQLSSLQICLPHLSEETNGFLMALVDHPLVSPRTYLTIHDHAQKQPDKIIIPVYKGTKGHPVYFGSRYIPELLAAPPDRGARTVVRANQDNVILIDVDDKGILRDIDLPEDYAYYVSEQGSDK